MTFDGNKPVTTSYDLPVTEPLRELMRRGWGSREAEPIAPHASAPWAAARRERLSALFPGKRLLDRKSTRLNSSHVSESRMPSSA